MKTFKYLFILAALGVSITSCNDLELEPKGLLYENVLFQSDNGIKKYMALIYQDLPIEDFNYKQNGDEALRQSIKEVGILVINGKPKKVARLPLEQKLPVAILHMVMVGDIGLMTESVISIIS